MSMTSLLKNICFQENKKFLFSLCVQKNGHTNRRTIDKATSNELETLLHIINCIQTGLLPIDPLHEKKIIRSGRNCKLQKFDLSVARMMSEDDQRTILKQFGSVFCFLLHRLFHDPPVEWVCPSPYDKVKLSKHDVMDHWRIQALNRPPKLSFKGLKCSLDLKRTLQGSEDFLWQIFLEKDGHTNRRLLSNANNQEVNALWHIIRCIQQDMACLSSHNIKKIKKSGKLPLLKKLCFQTILLLECKSLCLKSFPPFFATFYMCYLSIMRNNKEIL